MAQMDWAAKYPDMVLVKKAPKLIALHGCGLGMRGRRDADAETGTHVETWCITILYFPILALRAYRVARPDRTRWYFIGRVGLSRFAKLWNIVLLAAVLATVGMVQFQIYLASPAYQEKVKMSQAAAEVGQGHLTQGAAIYEDVALRGTGQAENATAAVKDLIGGACQSAPLTETAGVLASAGRIARRHGGIENAMIVDAGMKLVDAKGDSDPRGGMAVLGAIEPLVLDTRPIEQERFGLLKKWVAKEPGELEAVVPLASLLEHKGELPEAKAMLLPVKDKLGDGEGARVLGMVLGREGDLDGSYALLWPYVQGRLSKLDGAEAAYTSTSTNVWNKHLQILREKKGPASFYTKYQEASESQRQELVDQYLDQAVKNDPAYAGAQEELQHAAAVVPVALDLGIVMLERAQSQNDPAAKKSQLEATEKVFLAIGGVAGKSDEYRLSLGQVDYWLGKQAEGKKLFDDFLTAKARDYDSLMVIASHLRNVGADSDARAVVEEAYDKAGDKQRKSAAASFRAVMQRDPEDGIEWMNKTDLSVLENKATLAKALGEKAYGEGHEEEAVRQYRETIDAYGKLPRTPITLNETALAYSDIYLATGDRASFDKCVDYFQQAVDLDPKNPLLLYNAASLLFAGGVADVIGGEIDLRALRQSGSVDLLGGMYHDQASRAAVVARVKEHPAVQRAISYLKKAVVLSPKNADYNAFLYSVLLFLHDDAGLQAMAEAVPGADIDHGNQLRDLHRYLNGERDNELRERYAALLAREQKICDAVRPGKGRTAGVAVSQQVEALVGSDAFQETDPDQAVALAQEAVGYSASAQTSSVLVAAHLFRAAKTMAKQNAGFAAFYQKYARTLGASLLMAQAAGEPSDFQQAVLANSDFQQAAALMKEQEQAYPATFNEYEWELMKGADPRQAVIVAEGIRKLSRQKLGHVIASQISPADMGEAMSLYWYDELLGKDDEAQAEVARMAALGVALPVKPAGQ